MVGRRAELASLRSALDDPDCGGVVFVGGPGFGKTRLAHRSVDVAQERGMDVASVRATQGALSVPFAALVPLFEHLGVQPEVEDSLLPVLVDAIDARRGVHRLVLVVDDAQDLDDPSAGLLDQLVRWAAVFVVYTVRSPRANGEPVTGIWNDVRIRRIDVGPLPKNDLCAVVEMALGGPVDGSTLQAFSTASGGNPLFLRELIQGAAESGSLVCELGLWRLGAALAHSPRLRDLIEQRTAGLGRREREALEITALSDPVDLALLADLVPLEALETLEDRGLVDVVGEGASREVHVSHPLYGDVVRARLPALRRARHCRALAEAAEARGVAPGPGALRVAVWRLDGGEIGTYASTLEGAQAALRTGDVALASRLGQVAWQHWASVDAALVYGDALDALGRCREAEQVLGRAATLATTDRQRTNLAVRRAAALFRSLGDAPASDRVVAETVALVSDPACRRELDALRGNHLLLAGDVAGAIALGRPLLELPGDAAFAQASLDVGTGLAMAGRTEEAIRHTGEALAARVNLDDAEQLSAVGVYLVAQTLAHLHAGHLEEAAAIGDAGYQVAIEKGSDDGQAWFSAIMGLVRLAQGRPVSSGNLFREAALLFGRLQHPGQRWGLGGLALASAHLGRRSEAGEALAQIDAIAPTTVHLQDIGILRGRAWASVAGGATTAAREQLWEAATLAERWGQFAAAAEALHDLVRIGVEGPAVTNATDRTAERVDGAFMPARVAFARAAAKADHRLACEATDRFEVIGAALFAAEAATLESRLAAADGLHRRSGAAADRAKRLLAGCEGAVTPGLARAAEGPALTLREREVAHLAGQGLTSREIAERLFVSARTVDNHLQRVYVKLGIKGRSELGR